MALSHPWGWSLVKCGCSEHEPSRTQEILRCLWTRIPARSTPALSIYDTNRRIRNRMYGSVKGQGRRLPSNSIIGNKLVNSRVNEGFRRKTSFVDASFMLLLVEKNLGVQNEQGAQSLDPLPVNCLVWRASVRPLSGRTPCPMLRATVLSCPPYRRFTGAPD